ncbi:MAG: RuBisCO accumulation factor 1 [Jaaginema sp. PMC 1079.18]|nr:RuBisCO accumulation factor 1 [Jaaginema sp. PMC 1079.18]
MTNNPSPLSDDAARELLQKLRRKEGNWVDWGKACYQLQQAGYPATDIFEDTGIEASQQNLVIVASQVYDSIVRTGASAQLQQYCQGPRSDVIYELRILNQDQRLAAAMIAQEKQLDVDATHEVVRALKEFARFFRPPQGFEHSPGDAIAYYYWKLARGKKDLQARSRLIAQALRFAESQGARGKIEQLLSDFTIVPTARAPMLPLYRLEAEEQIPRLVPVVGEMPLSLAEVEAVDAIAPQGLFGICEYNGKGAVVSVPGWQAVLKAIDPVALITRLEDLPSAPEEAFEQALVVVDRSTREWNASSYFLMMKGDRVEIEWYPESPSDPIVGQVVLILRPKKILDERNILEPWQMDD